MDDLVNGKSLENPIYLLADNGSFEAGSTLSLRKTAHYAGLLAGVEILPVSLLHSFKVDPSLLDGIKAETMEPFLAGRLLNLPSSCESFLFSLVRAGP